jgi:hypothetical protein
VGDFHYRKNPCIDSSTECGTSPFGDNWATWREEFFEPAKPLLLAAPWKVAPGPAPAASSPCRDDVTAERPATAIVPGQYREHGRRACALADTSDEGNTHQVEANCERYRKQLDKLKAEEPDRSTQEVWLAMHQPLWGRNMSGEQEASPNGLQKLDESKDHEDIKALDCVNGKTRSALPVILEKFEMAKDKRIARLVFAGDNHAFQFIWPTDGLSPIQIIAGNGGTKLDTLYPLLKPPGTKKEPGDKRDPDTAPPETSSENTKCELLVRQASTG